MLPSHLSWSDDFIASSASWCKHPSPESKKSEKAPDKQLKLDSPVIVGNAIDFVVDVDSERDTVKALVTNAAPKTTGVI